MAKSYASILDEFETKDKELLIAETKLQDEKLSFLKRKILVETEKQKIILKEQSDRKREEIRQKNEKLSIEQQKLNRDLLCAIVKGELKKVTEYLSLGADPNYCEIDPNFIPLCLNFAKYEITILKNGSYELPTIISGQVGITPLILACNFGNLNLVKELIQFKANINETNVVLQTPLMYACAHGYNEIAKYLLDLGAEIKHQAYLPFVYFQCVTAFHAACQSCSLEIVTQMVNQGADLKIIHNLTTAFGCILHPALLYRMRDGTEAYNPPKDYSNPDCSKILNFLLSKGVKLREELLIYRLSHPLDETLLIALFELLPILASDIKLQAEAECYNVSKKLQTLDMDILRSKVSEATAQFFGVKLQPYENNAIFKILYPKLDLSNMKWVARKAISFLPQAITNITGKPLDLDFDADNYFKLLQYFSNLTPNCPLPILNLMMQYIDYNSEGEHPEINNLHLKRLDYFLQNAALRDKLMQKLIKQEKCETEKAFEQKNTYEVKKIKEANTSWQDSIFEAPEFEKPESLDITKSQPSMSKKEWLNQCQRQMELYLKMEPIQRKKLHEIREKYNNMDPDLIAHSEALMKAIAGGSLMSVEEEVKAGADINFADPSSNFTMDDPFDVYYRNYKRMRGRRINVCPGRTPLLFAIHREWWSIVDYLLDHKASVNQSDFSFETPLMLACLKGKDELIKKLLEMNADVTPVTGFWTTSLNHTSNILHYYFRSYGHHVSALDIAKIAYEKGVDIFQPDFNGFTPLSLLIHRLPYYNEPTLPSTIDFFISQGADLFQAILIDSLNAHTAAWSLSIDRLQACLRKLPQASADLKLVIEALYFENENKTESMDLNKLKKWLIFVVNNVYRCNTYNTSVEHQYAEKHQTVGLRLLDILYPENQLSELKISNENTLINENANVSYDHKPYQALHEALPQFPAKALGLIHEYQHKVFTPGFSDQISNLHRARFCVLTNEKMPEQEKVQEKPESKPKVRTYIKKGNFQRIN